MKSITHIILPILTGLVLNGCNRNTRAVATTIAAHDDGTPISFNDAIQPILSRNCYHCHGPDSGTREPKKKPLRLDREKFAFLQREDGKPVILPGDTAGSRLLHVIHSTDPDEVMPPPKSHNQLTAEEKNLLERWVAQGAKYEEHWSFIPPSRPLVPEVATPAVVANPVDAFIQGKLEKSSYRSKHGKSRTPSSAARHST